MYDIRKIIILGNFNKNDQSGIETVAMQTDGLKIENILYINSSGIIGDSKKDLKNEIREELYADQYDDDLKIKIKEAINGEDCMYKLCDWIIKKWNSNTLIYYYNPNDECYDILYNELKNYDSSIYIENYNKVFDSSSDIDIYEMMQRNGLKVENLIQDNNISMVYFLSALVEKLYSK